MNNEKILIAMSGGVDSAVAALLLSRSGADCAGITMRLWDTENPLPDALDVAPDANCAEAKAICDTLGIPHYSVSLGESFCADVVDYFSAEYVAGRTPNPCVECNKQIKFGKLFDIAEHYGASKLATGHYARIIHDASGDFRLCRAADGSKDQSYFLWSIDRSRLSNILFPLGDLSKPEIREIAEKNNFSNAHKKDSQDICFVPNGEYASFIRTRTGLEFPSGSFVDIHGNALGQHSGLINYTVGQRKGLGIALGRPMFVKAKDASLNTVTLSSDEELYSNTVVAKSINLLACDHLTLPERFSVKIRYRHTPAPATVTQVGEDTLLVKFDEPQRAAAAGQSLVIYDGDTVIGGGIIE